MPSEQALTLYQSDDETLAVAITDDDTGDPVDLTGLSGSSITMTITGARGDGGGDTLAIGSGITLADADSGLITVEVPASLTASPGRRWYRIRVTSGGDTKTAAYGPLIVLAT